MKYVYVYGNILGAAGQIIMYLLVLCIKWIVLFPTLSRQIACWVSDVEKKSFQTHTMQRLHIIAHII